MFIPWLGEYLGARLLSFPRVGCDGSSDMTGFVIRTSVHGEIKEWRTDSYSSYASDRKSALAVLLWFLIIISICFIALLSTAVSMIIGMLIGYSPPFLTLLGYWLMAILILTFLSFASAVRGPKSIWREYHACEHKVAILLEAGVKPSFENLCTAPANLCRCGSSVLASLLSAMVIVDLGIVLDRTALLIAGISLVVFIMFYLINTQIIFELLKKRCNGKLFKRGFRYAWSFPLNISFALLSAAMLFPPLFQQLVSLRKPRQSILQEGVQLMQRIHSSYHQ